MSEMEAQRAAERSERVLEVDWGCGDGGADGFEEGETQWGQRG